MGKPVKNPGVAKQPATGREWSRTIDEIWKEAGKLGFPDQTWDLEPVSPSPCKVDCPAEVNVKGYVGLIAEQRFQEALELIKETNPFPGICGRVCAHPCEHVCNRSKFGGPVAIRVLKRFISDWELRHRPAPSKLPRPTGSKVAIIGAGPAGLTAASDLARAGCRVTVFEASPSPGGMMRWAIPTFRLPRKILKTEVEAIKALGVKIKLGARLGKNLTLGDLKDQGFEAIFLALGAQKSVKLNIPGEKSRGVIDALSFLRKASSGKGKRPGKIIAVIGGGNSAIDAARCAVRLGAGSVTVLYRRTQNEMPAAWEEVRDAVAEGVLFRYLTTPTRIVPEDGQVRKIECIHMKLGKPDDSGRRRPMPQDGTEFTLDVDTVIAAIGQQADLSGLLEGTDGISTEYGRIKVDGETLAAGAPGIFAGGDVVTGPKTIVMAIGQGHVAAKGILGFLTGNSRAPEVAFRKAVEIEVPLQLISSKERIRPRLANPGIRRRNFKEVEGALTIHEAVGEAERCLRCGPCSECKHCLPTCPKEWVVLTDLRSGDVTANLPIRCGEHRNFVTSGSVTEGVLGGKDRATQVPVWLHNIIARIDPVKCRSCGKCLEVCSYEAPVSTGREAGFAHRNPYIIDEERCKGCGICLAVCPTGAVELGFYTPQLYAEMVRRAISEVTR